VKQQDDEPPTGDVFDFAARQMADTIREDFRARGLDPETGLPPAPRRSMRMYGCRKVIEGDFDERGRRLVGVEIEGRRYEVASADPVLCMSPSVYVARDSSALYGHVCAECWESLGPIEQALYFDPEKEGSEK
jgi:hypothetical protein